MSLENYKHIPIPRKMDFVVGADGEISGRRGYRDSDLNKHTPELLDSQDFIIPKKLGNEVYRIEVGIADFATVNNFAQDKISDRLRTQKNLETYSKPETRAVIKEAIIRSGRNTKMIENPRAIIEAADIHLDSLTAAQRWVIDMRYRVGNRSHNQLAKIANCSVQNISKLEGRALRNLIKLSTSTTT